MGNRKQIQKLEAQLQSERTAFEILGQVVFVLLFLLLVGLCSGCGAEYIPKQLQVDTELAPIVREFQARCAGTAYSKRCSKAWSGLLGVTYKELQAPTIGLARTRRTKEWRLTKWVVTKEIHNVWVDPSATVSPELLRFVVYHELGHVIGMPHSTTPDTCIMHPYAREIVSAKEWDDCVRQLFTAGK